MKKLTLALICLTCMAPARIFAQAVQVSFDTKVIYCDSLNMPVNTTALELMNLLPELRQRPGSMLLDNYELKVQGMSINQGKDAALAELLIEDIEKIEVEESPMSGYLNNGAGGSINIILRQKGPKTDKIWGNATLSASYPMDVAPQLLLGHRSDKVMVHGLLLGDIYNNKSTSEQFVYGNDGRLTANNRKDIDSRYRTQLARAYLQIAPSDKDQIELKLSETFTSTRTSTTPDYQTDYTQTQRKQSVLVHALAKYKHSFTPRTSLLFEGQYIYAPAASAILYPNEQSLDTDSKSHTAAGKVEFASALLPKSSRANLRLVTGSNFNYNTNRQTVASFYDAYNYHYDGQQHYTTFFAQPFLRFELTAGKWRAKIEGQFQHYKYQPADSAVTSNDFTGMLTCEYHFTPHQNLRLMLNRSLQRPSSAQVNTLPVFDAQASNYVIGNNALQPSLSHEARLDYLSDYHWGEHGLMLDLSTSYNRVSDIIISTLLGHKEALPGVNLDCISYENNGLNHILNANLMAMYTYRAVTLTFNGNAYHNEQRIADTKNHYTFFNLSLYGQFRLPSGWQGAANVTYYSKVYRANATLSDCAVSTLSIAKSITKHFSAYVFARVVMQQKAKDITNESDGSYTLNCYNMLTNAVGLGLRYAF